MAGDVDQAALDRAGLFPRLGEVEDRALGSAIQSTVMIAAIIACSTLFANYLAVTRVTQTGLAVINDPELPRQATLLPGMMKPF